MATKTEAYAQYGAKLTNARWSWSAKAADAVVLTLWMDKFDWTATPPSYDGSHEPGDKEALGNKERRKHLAWAREHCGGRIRVVMAMKSDDVGKRRKVKHCFAQPSLILFLTTLDPETGEFQAVIVSGT